MSSRTCAPLVQLATQSSNRLTIPLRGVLFQPNFTGNLLLTLTYARICTPMSCCQLARPFSQGIGEHMTNELTDLATSTMNIKAVAPPLRVEPSPSFQPRDEPSFPSAHSRLFPFLIHRATESHFETNEVRVDVGVLVESHMNSCFNGCVCMMTKSRVQVAWVTESHAFPNGTKCLRHPGRCISFMFFCFCVQFRS